MKKLPHKKLIGNFAVLTGGRLLGAAATFLTSLLIARKMGADTLGHFSVLLAAAGIISVLVAGGFPAIASVFTAKLAASDQKGVLRSLIAAGQRHVIFGTIGSLIAALVYLTTTGASLPSAIWTATIAASAAFGIAATNLFGSVLVGLNRQQAGLLPDTFIKPFLFLAFVAGIVLSQGSVSPTNLLACFAAAAIAAAIYAYTQLKSEAFMGYSLPAESKRQGWWKKAYPWIITTLVWDFFIELHIILAGLIAAPAQVAVLHIAFRFRMLAGFGMRTLYALHLPDIVTAHTQDKPLIAQQKLFQVNLLALAYSAGVLAFFALSGSYLMGMFGASFKTGWDILLILSATMIIRALFGPAPAILSMREHQNVPAIIMTGCLLFSLAGSLLLYPQLGLTGIAISYTSANLIGSAVLWYLTKRLTGIDGSLFCMIKPKTRSPFTRSVKLS